MCVLREEYVAQNLFCRLAGSAVRFWALPLETSRSLPIVGEKKSNGRVWMRGLARTRTRDEGVSTMVFLHFLEILLGLHVGRDVTRLTCKYIRINLYSVVMPCLHNV